MAFTGQCKYETNEWDCLNWLIKCGKVIQIRLKRDTKKIVLMEKNRQVLGQYVREEFGSFA